MGRELKKVPAYFLFKTEWFLYMKLLQEEQNGAAFKYAVSISRGIPAELPKDPAAAIMAMIMEKDIKERFEGIERGEVPYVYVDENGNRMSEIYNALTDIYGLNDLDGDTGE